MLFLDEINLAPPVMQGVAQQLVLDRRVGSYEVPPGWFVWAAGNRKQDRAAVFDMPAPLANRFLHLNAEVHLESFRQYAHRRKFDPLIIGFLNFRPSLLRKMDSNHEAWPSPRTWEMAHGLLEAGLDLTPAIGVAAAAEFRVYQETAELIPTVSGERRRCREAKYGFGSTARSLQCSRCSRTIASMPESRSPRRTVGRFLPVVCTDSKEPSPTDWRSPQGKPGKWRQDMNAVINRMTPSITAMIRMDHSHVLALSHRYTPDTSVNKKRALVTNACIALQVHAQLEEEIFYPALRNVLANDEVLEKSEPEHEQMRELITELREQCESGGAVDKAFDEKFMALMRIVIHHAADEETWLLPAAERLMRDELGRLGVEMTRRRVELMRPHARDVAVSAARSFPVGAATGAALVTAGAVAVGAMWLSRNKNGRRGGSWQGPDPSDRPPSRFT